MFYAYIIKSITTNKYYIGSCEDVEKRLHQHNSGKTKSIKHKGPFILQYIETFGTRVEAYRREKQIKSYKSGNAFKKLLEK